ADHADRWCWPWCVPGVLRGDGSVHRLNERDHDELSGGHRGHADLADEHPAIYLLGWVRFSIAFYEVRLLLIPSGEHSPAVQRTQEFGGCALHQLPCRVVVGLEGDPRKTGLQRPPQHDEKTADRDVTPLRIRGSGAGPPRSYAPLDAERVDR